MSKIRVPKQVRIEYGPSPSKSRSLGLLVHTVLAINVATNRIVDGDDRLPREGLFNAASAMACRWESRGAEVLPLVYLDPMPTLADRRKTYLPVTK